MAYAKLKWVKGVGIAGLTYKDKEIPLIEVYKIYNYRYWFINRTSPLSFLLDTDKKFKNLEQAKIYAENKLIEFCDELKKDLNG